MSKAEPLTLTGEGKRRMIELVNMDAPVTMMLGYLCMAFESSDDPIERDIGTAIETLVQQVFHKHNKDLH